MIVRDILPDRPIDIEVRTYGPKEEDILFGFCHWDERCLISGDGDYYSTFEEIVKYEFNDDVLTYWIKSGWM